MAEETHEGHGSKPKAGRERKLPIQQLSILAVCRFAEPIASTSVLPYLPEMVQSFGIAPNEIAKWAGLCAAVFSLCQAVMGIPWGRASDRYGRKPAILLGLCSTMFTSLLWGFSTSLPMAIAARALAGAGNGNVGIIRTTVAEMVPFKELQPRAFSLMPLVWNVGSIFGPSIGGALANPLRIDPVKRGTPGYTSFLKKYPYALPNIVAACFFFVGITVGYLFLEETLETKKGQLDFGLRAGRWLRRTVKHHVLTVGSFLHLRKSEPSDTSDERAPLLNKHTRNGREPEEGIVVEPKKVAGTPGFREVLNRQACLNLMVYTFLAMHTMTYDSLLPVFMHYTPLCSTEGASEKCNAPASGFFKFAGGFGLPNQSIGLLQTALGAVSMVTQFFFFPPIARKLGVLYCMKVCAIVFPITYFLTPFTALLTTTPSQMAACFVIMILKGGCATFAFPCSTILLTNSASSLRVLGTLNGFATMVSAIGRAIGPAVGGATFTLGVKRGFVIAPWWLLSAVGIISAIPVFFLVEGEGFGGDDGHVSDEEEIDESDEEALLIQGIEGEAEAAGKPGPVPVAAGTSDHPEEEGYGSLGPLLSRQTTVASDTIEEEEDDAAAGPARRSSQPKSRRGSITKKVRRESTLPIGINQGITRRYSGNLGASLGSAGSFHGM